MRKLYYILFILLITSHIYSINYITTAESISWNGAYTSASDGFEAMLYNPAGLYLTDAKFGINFFGSWGARIYSNSMSTDDFIKISNMMQNGTNLSSSSILSDMLLYMPDTGFDLGFNVSAANILTYFKLKNFAFGISFIPKTSVTLLMSKEIFNTVFNQLNLTEPVSLGVKTTMVQYLDLNFMLSTRAKFLEKVIPVDAIYVGMSTHLYFPTFLMKTNTATVELAAGTANPTTGFIDNYLMHFTGNLCVGGNYLTSEILKNIPGLSDYASPYLAYAASIAFGLGFDFGFTVQFNRMIRLGFSVTDLGFMVFPNTAINVLDLTADVSIDSIGSFAEIFRAKSLSQLMNNEISKSGAEWWMPSTSCRVGVAIIPLKNKRITLAADISISDLNRLVNGEYPTFNFATGVEFLPGYKWFAAPIRIAFSYNSQANYPSISLGLGLYFGPVEMEFAVKGLEFLIIDWGTKEAEIGADLKFEF